MPSYPRSLAILALSAAVLGLPATAAAKAARHHGKHARHHAAAARHHAKGVAHRAPGPVDGGAQYPVSAVIPTRSTGTTSSPPNSGGTIAGPLAGSTEPTGPTGPSGAAGPTGPTGAGGGTLAPSAPTGATGATGAPGPAGGPVAQILPDGLAQAPADAPAAVQQAIAAGNQLIGQPYLYGGGHASFISIGYDCSGAVSFALHGANLLASPLDSSAFELWGVNGAGQWITVYTNPQHAYVEIAGVRLDTSRAGDANGQTGPRWRPLLSTHTGFVARHPAGL